MAKLETSWTLKLDISAEDRRILEFLIKHDQKDAWQVSTTGNLSFDGKTLYPVSDMKIQYVPPNTTGDTK